MLWEGRGTRSCIRVHGSGALAVPIPVNRYPGGMVRTETYLQSQSGNGPLIHGSWTRDAQQKLSCGPVIGGELTDDLCGWHFSLPVCIIWWDFSLLLHYLRQTPKIPNERDANRKRSMSVWCASVRFAFDFSRIFCGPQHITLQPMRVECPLCIVRD